tara:strand:- start:399 stop:584 length:186 start_codon:yes stop_codon:yes gene_type:complete
MGKKTEENKPETMDERMARLKREAAAEDKEKEEAAKEEAKREALQKKIVETTAQNPFGGKK